MIDDRTHAIVADPERSGPVEAALEARRLELTGILWTRHRAAAGSDVDVLRSRGAARSALVHRDGLLPSIDFR
jgi:hypothetical protein